MCNKVTFLVSLVYLLGPASSVWAADLIVPWGDTYTVSGTEEYNVIECEGMIIVPSGATLIMNSRSYIDHNWGDGEGGTGATILVDGGTFVMRNRLDMGKGNDAYLIVDNDGTVIHTGEKVTIPDNDGGEHRLIVRDGTYTAEETELIWDRGSVAILGCMGVLTTCNVDEGTYNDPQVWFDNGALWCESCGYPVIVDVGGGCKEVVCCPCGTCYAYWPKPKNNATGVGAVTCDMAFSWMEGNCLGTKGRNHIFFSSDQDCVANSPSPSVGWTPPPCYLGQTVVGNDSWNVGPLPLWTKYYWRIDQGCADGSTCRGDVWTFTTGCPLIPGDVNLDCMVNFLDYAEVASTWMGEEFFPDGCTP